MNDLFCDCWSLTSIDLSNFNTNNVKSMYSMFDSCIKITSINLSNFNTNNVENMSYMFHNCRELISLGISNFNCDNIKTADKMKDMFSGSNKLKIENIKYKDFKIRGQMIIDLKI